MTLCTRCGEEEAVAYWNMRELCKKCFVRVREMAKLKFYHEQKLRMWEKE